MIRQGTYRTREGQEVPCRILQGPEEHWFISGWTERIRKIGVLVLFQEPNGKVHQCWVRYKRVVEAGKEKT